MGRLDEWRWCSASTHCWIVLSFLSISTCRSVPRAVPSPVSVQPVFVLGIVPALVQGPALGLVELREGILSLQCADHTTQLCVAGKLAEALNPTVHACALSCSSDVLEPDLLPQ